MLHEILFSAACNATTLKYPVIMKIYEGRITRKNLVHFRKNLIQKSYRKTQKSYKNPKNL